MPPDPSDPLGLAEDDAAQRAALTDAQKKGVVGLVKKHRFNRVCVGMFRTDSSAPHNEP